MPLNIRPKLCVIMLLGMLTNALDALEARSQQIDGNLCGTDGTINSIIHYGNTVYVGGSFTQAGPNCGGAVPLSLTTAQPPTSFPRVAGTVSTIAPDGAGGWYIGGAFVAVGGERRSNLAHILPSGAVAVWAPDADAEVLTLRLHGQTVYVGGYFNHVGGQSRAYVAAIDAASGAATEWNPAADLQVRALLIRDSGVYVGGDFTTIGGQPRHSLAVLDSVTGQARSWNPDVGFSGTRGSVRALAALADSALLIGGDFWTVGADQRRHLAIISTTSALASNWNPTVTGPSDAQFGDPYISALTVRGSTVYVGGHFTGVGGQARNGLAEVSLTTGLATSWNPNAVDVTCLSLQDSTIYAGGFFRSVGGVSRPHLAEISVASGQPTSWNPNANDAVKAIAFHDQSLYAGGLFTGIGSQWKSRANLAAFDASTGELREWDPHPNGLGVWSLLAHQGLLYVGGHFDFIGGQLRSGLAAVDTIGGAATDWDASTDNIVTAMATAGDTLYIGGVFQSVAGHPRNRLAALELSAGGLISWDPSADSDVFGLAVDDHRVYVAGFFSMIGGVSRRFGIAAVDGTTGAVLDWNPQSDNWVNAVAVKDSTVFVGGRFSTIGGRSRMNLAALDPITGEAKNWIANTNAEVFALAIIADTLYAGGSFFIVGGEARAGLVAIDARTDSVLPWKADLSRSEWFGPGTHAIVRSLFAHDNSLYLAGLFGRVGETPASNLAAVAFGSQPGPVPPPQSLHPVLVFPNPAYDAATVRFALPTESFVSVGIFDLQGRLVSSPLTHELRPAGTGEIVIHTRGLPEGCYFCRLSAGRVFASRKFVVSH